MLLSFQMRGIRGQMGTGGWLWWIELRLLPNTLLDFIIHISPIPVHSLKQLLPLQLCITKITLVRCFAHVLEAGGGAVVQGHQGARSHPTHASSGCPGLRACAFIKQTLSPFSVQFPVECPHVFSAGGRGGIARTSQVSQRMGQL